MIALLVGFLPEKKMDFADVLNALSEHIKVSSWTIKGLVSYPDLKDFDKQETDMPILPVKYVKQSGCGDYGFYGTIYFPTTYTNGDGGVMHIHVEYAD